MKIALIQTPVWGTYDPPLALAGLSSSLKREGHEVCVFDINIELYHKRKESYKNAWAWEQSDIWYDAAFVSNFFKTNWEEIDKYIDAIFRTGAVEFIRLFKRGSTRKIAFGIISLFLLPCLFFNLKILKEYYVDVKKTGGQFIWSDAIYELANWLRETRPSKIVTVNWGLSRNLYFLLGGEKYIYDFHRHSDTGYDGMETMRRYMDFFHDENNVYLVNLQWPDNLDRGLFEKAVEASGMQLIEARIFNQRNGRPVYAAYSVR